MSFICKKREQENAFLSFCGEEKKRQRGTGAALYSYGGGAMRSREFRNEMEYALHLAKRRKLRRIEGMKLRWRVRSKNGQKVGDGWSDRTRTIGQGPWR